MTKENIILYAKILRNVFETTNAVEIARRLRYNVGFIKTGTQYLKANTYKFEDGLKVILINDNYDAVSKNVLCAHELGHAVFNHANKSNYKDTNLANEYEVNLFAVALPFDEGSFNMPLAEMSNYTLQSILDANITPPG